MSSVDELNSISLRSSMPGDDIMQINTQWLSMSVQKTAADQLTGLVHKQEDISMDIPDYCEMIKDTMSCNATEAIIARQVKYCAKKSLVKDTISSPFGNVRLSYKSRLSTVIVTGSTSVVHNKYSATSEIAQIFFVKSTEHSLTEHVT
jgi:hypothetical protein